MSKIFAVLEAIGAKSLLAEGQYCAVLTPVQLEAFWRTAQKAATIEITAAQAQTLVDMIWPEGTEGAEKDNTATLQVLPARTSTEDEDMPAGLYAWITDYPGEGCFQL